MDGGTSLVISEGWVGTGLKKDVNTVFKTIGRLCGGEIEGGWEVIERIE